ncbi:type I-E CRISPR-associated protein Cse1/CasA [Streptomyces sp. NPDC046925]|uniref:type I-E CRISPR-associated protein Cse1/CasA n=1 Tax=Streptomyces sp. NPDC046925 TaxID=3155375 RepID=UPI0033EA48A7
MLSLVEVFEQAENIQALVHASPGVRVALHELLLGLCYATGVHPRSEREWDQWVASRHSLADVAEQLRDPRFDGLLDLTHPEHPFGQNKLLDPHMAEHGYGTAQLEIERAGDYAQFADHVHLHDPRPLPLHEAFHGVLVQNCYGLGGRAMAKTSWFGRPFTFAAVGRLGARVRNLALGENLADTLRLNLVPTTRPGDFNFSWTRGKPRRFGTPGANYRRTPGGPADLHSVLGRSILLHPTRTEQGETVIDRVLIGAGELLNPPGEDELQDAVMDGDYPQQARPDKALWRQSHALYAAATPDTKGTGLLSRLARLDRPVQIWSVALLAKQRKPLGWVSDTFPYHRSSQRQLHHAASAAVVWADYLTRAASSAAAVARDAAYPRARPEERASLLKRLDPAPQMWAGFEAPFHALLDAVTAGVPLPQAQADCAAAFLARTRDALGQRLGCLPRSGAGREAKVLAEHRLNSELHRPKTPRDLKDAMPSTPQHAPAALPAPSTTPGQESDEREPHTKLAHWLARLVRTHDQRLLGELRRPHSRDALQARSIATSFADREDQEEAFALTARLFARYHVGLPYQEPVRQYGTGNLGSALRHLGSPAGRGPKDPGVKRLFKNITANGPLPERALEHAIARLRADNRFPPHWGQLALDLAALSKSTQSGDVVADTWARSFYTPTSRTRQGATA